MTRLVLVMLVAGILAQTAGPPSRLPPTAVAQLTASLASARPHGSSVWRDTPPFADRGLLRGYVEIGRGDRRKFEFDIGANALRLDRMIAASLGGYPVNYGIVPQTVSYDGDPFDVLVLGPAIASGTLVHGVIVGLMQMEDEKGLDSKVVISPVDAAGKPRYRLTASDRQRIGTFFANYKRDEPGKFSRVPGWGSAADGLAFVQMTHAFFERCRVAAAECVVPTR